MNDFIGISQCITHHRACDCREEKFKQIEAENEKLREVVEKYERWIKIDEVKALRTENKRLNDNYVHTVKIAEKQKRKNIRLNKELKQALKDTYENDSSGND